MKKYLLVMFFALLVVGMVEAQVESWTHVVQASEYKPAKTEDGQEYLVYTYYDDRFNTKDWFDTWIEVWWEESDGWSDFAPTMDMNLNMFLYDVVYYDGYVSWRAYTADLDLLVGVRLKFFQMKVR